MFILYFVLWVILNGKWTTEIGLFGVAFAAVAYVFSCKYMGYKLSVDFALISRIPSAVRYGATLLREIVKANVTVMKMILDRDFEPKPQLVQFDAGLVRDRHRVALANSITLTPGTITVSLDGDHYVVHCLDASLVDGLDDGDMPTLLREMEKKHLAQDAKKAAMAAESQTQIAPETVEVAEGIKSADAVEAIAEEAVAAPETDEEAAVCVEQEAKEDEHEH